jgi:addiction module HigA family antidote
MASKSRSTPPVHPGEILRVEFMEPNALSAYALAKALGLPAPRVNDIVRERRGISTETGLLLSAFFGLSPDFWTNLQGEYERRTTAPRLARRLARIRPLAAMQA